MERNMEPNDDPFPKLNECCWCPLKKEIESLRAKLAASEGRVRVLGDAMDKIHAKVMVEYPEVIYDIADKALALIDRSDSEVKGEKG